MEKNINRFVYNAMAFWIIADIMPGLVMPHGVGSKLIDGILFAGVMVIMPYILNFFKFPVNFWGKFLIGTILTTTYLYLLDLLFPKLLDVTTGYIGGGDFLLFSFPILITLPNAILVIVISAIILVLCSIILDRLNRH